MMLAVIALSLAAPKAAPYCYYTMRCPNGSWWFQTKAPIAARGTFKPTKGSLLFKDTIVSVDVDPDAPLGAMIVATSAGGTKTMWLIDRASLAVAGDHKTDVGLDGTLSVTIKP